MPELQPSKSKGAPIAQISIGRLFILDLSGNRVLSLKPDSSDCKVIVTDCRHPDGIAVDVEGGHFYWSNMGVPNLNDGSIERADLNGRNRKTIIPQGGTFTPKQIQLDKPGGKLYWSDREGMRVMRANLDGSRFETLVETSQGEACPGRDQTKWCVGIAVDAERGQIYWTQKGPDKGGLGRLFRANIEIPKGETAARRSDIEVLFNSLPEPIDLGLDLENRLIYWTDRGDPPRGNTVNCAPMDAPSPHTLPSGGEVRMRGRPAPEILFRHLMEGIGIALDFKGGRMFLTDLAGSVYTAKLDGSGKRTLLAAQGNLTGIAYVELPPLEQ